MRREIEGKEMPLQQKQFSLSRYLKESCYSVLARLVVKDFGSPGRYDFAIFQYGDPLPSILLAEPSKQSLNVLYFANIFFS